MKISTFGTIIVLLVIILAPCINASITKNSIVNSNNQVQNDDGKIRGCTITYGFEPNTIIGAKVVLEGDNIAKRVTYTGLLGKFEFKNVPLGWQYTVTVSHRKYETKSKTVVLTEEEPDVFLMFTLALKDDILSKSTYEELEIHQDSGKYGMIVGFVGTYGFPPPLPITGAKLVLEGGSCKRIAFSGPYGGFRFYFLEFERQYTITATHPYYQTVTKTITISADDPIYLLGISMKDKDESKTKSEEPACLGSIRGGVIRFYGGGWQDPIPFAKIDIGIRKTRANRFGQYRINFLPVNRTYTVTASAKGYQSETREITLTAEKPDGTVHFSLKESDVSIPKSKITENTNEPACLGSIWGNTGISDTWGFITVGLVKVEAGGKSTISSLIMGFYKIRNLPLGTYTVTGTKKGYDTFTDTVTLTEGHPDKQVFVHMEPNDENVKEKTNKEKIANEKIVENDDSGKYGRVSGMVHTGGFPPYTEISGAKLVLKGDAIKRITFSGPLGGYRFNFLTIGRPYSITITHPKYKTQTETFTPTADKPHIFLNFPMYEKTTRNTKIEEPACLGSIYGNTGEWYIWGFSPVGLVKVEAGGKTTISSPIMGFYKIRNLPLGTYTVTGTKKGHDTFTETVKLTEGHPDKQVFVHMEPNDESVNKARTQSYVKTTENNLMNNNGKISGDVKAPGYSLLVGVPGINVACGINKEDYVTTVTDDWGEFEFTDLPYENSGTEYKIWLMKSPGLIFLRSTKKVTLDSENPEKKIHFILPFVFFNRETINRLVTLER